MEKVILFGAGNNYRQHKTEYEKRYQIVGVVDNHYTNYKEEDIRPVSFINETTYDRILITTSNFKDMYDQLIEMGVSPSKIKIENLSLEMCAVKMLGNQYFGQHADDLIIEAIFARIGIEKPSYIDLGANHPLVGSNTAAMYLHGCRGINIEANPALMYAIEYARPEDINLNIGISVEEGILPFYKYNDESGLNTFSSSEAEQWWNESREIIELPVTTLKKITEEYCPDGFPDFLDCDIEGLDYAVLENYDLISDGPKVICVEVRENEIGKFDQMLDKKGYFRFCRIGENNIYVQKKFGRIVCHCDFL